MPHCFEVHYQDCKMIIDCTEVRTAVLHNSAAAPALFTLQGEVHPQASCSYHTMWSCVLPLKGLWREAVGCIHYCWLWLAEPSATRGCCNGRQRVAWNSGRPWRVTSSVSDSPFLQGEGQFSESNVRETYKISQVRIHVERAIQRIKMFHILNMHVPTKLIPALSGVFHICCILANLQPPIILENRQRRSNKAVLLNIRSIDVQRYHLCHNISLEAQYESTLMNLKCSRTYIYTE